MHENVLIKNMAFNRQKAKKNSYFVYDNYLLVWTTKKKESERKAQIEIG